MTKNSLRILHISDLHERAEFEGMPEARRPLIELTKEVRGRVLGREFDRALDDIAKLGAIDIVCFTGDVADWGHPNEYDVAATRIRALLTRLGVPLQRFFAVPGNHDVSRKTNEDVYRKFARFQGKGSVLGNWFRDVGDAPFGFDAPDRENLLARTESFWKWLDGMGRPDLRPREHRLLGYRSTITAGSLRHIQTDVHIIGLDSAWMCGGENDSAHIRITEEQVLGHIMVGEDSLQGFRIALVHHPLHCVVDGKNVKNLLAKKGVELLIHGHQHEPTATEINDPGTRLRVLATGCLLEGELDKSWPHGFQVIELDVNNNSGRVHLRKWAGEFWTKGTDIYPTADDGVLELPPLDTFAPDSSQGPGAKHPRRSPPPDDRDLPAPSPRRQPTPDAEEELPSRTPTSKNPRWILSTLLGIRPVPALMALVLVGVVLGALSHAIDAFDWVTVPPQGLYAKQVGYGSALNWSLGYFILFPIAATLMLLTLKEVPRVIDQVVRLNLVARPRQDAPSALFDSWVRGTRDRDVFVGFGIVVPFVVSLREWFTNNFLRLRGGGPLFDRADVDWGLRCRIQSCDTGERLINHALDLIAFLAQGFYWSLLVVFTIYIADLYRVFVDEAERLGLKFMPALLVTDKRRGFEAFEALLTRMLWIVLIAYLLTYLVRLQNIYLHDTSGFPTLWAFVHDDVMNGLWEGMKGGDLGGAPSRLMKNLFSPPSWSRQSVVSASGLLAFYIIAGGVLLLTVSLVAQAAKRNAIAHYAEAKAIPLFGLALETEKQRVEEMVVWPFGYLRLNVLLMGSAVAIASLYWYRLGLLIAGVTLGYLLFAAARAFSKVHE